MTASHVPRTLLITGVAGMLGSHIARQAIRRGYRVRGLDVVGDPLSLRELDVHYVRGDVRSDAALEELMAGIDPAGAVLVHAASIISIRSRPDPTMWSTNVGGTAAVLRACTRHRVTRTVYVSSCHAVPEVPRGQWMTEVDDYDPDLVAGGYAKTKATASRLVLQANGADLQAVIVNPCGMVGPVDFGTGPGVSVVRMIAQGIPAVPTGGSPYIDVRDAATGVLAAAEVGRAGESYLLSERSVSMREVADVVCSELGTRPPRFDVPAWVLAPVGVLVEWSSVRRGVEPLITPYAARTLCNDVQINSDKAIRELGLRPGDALEAFAETTRWLRDNDLLAGPPRTVVAGHGSG